MCVHSVCVLNLDLQWCTHTDTHTAVDTAVDTIVDIAIDTAVAYTVAVSRHDAVTLDGDADGAGPR